LSAGGGRAPRLARWLLMFPDRIEANLDAVRTAGIVSAPPNLWQLSLGVVRMIHRLMFRSHTVGVCTVHAVRRTWRAQWVLGVGGTGGRNCRWDEAVAVGRRSGIANGRPHFVVRRSRHTAVALRLGRQGFLCAVLCITGAERDGALVAPPWRNHLRRLLATGSLRLRFTCLTAQQKREDQRDDDCRREPKQRAPNAWRPLCKHGRVANGDVQGNIARSRIVQSVMDNILNGRWIHLRWHVPSRAI